MGMTERVRRLRAASLSAVPAISTERAELITQFYRQHAEACSEPVRRALAFRHLVERQTIYLGEDELIVGEKGPAPKETPTYPELCCHTLEDLDILDTRDKISFRVSSQARRVYQHEIIPFWHGRTMRERILAEMAPEWHAAYQAGVFTEFMEQRSPGHTVLDGKIYQKGMLDFQHDIDHALRSLDFLSDPGAYAKKEQLRAMRIAAGAIIRFAERHAELAEAQAAAARAAGRGE